MLCFSPAHLSGNYREELHQATAGEKRALNKDESVSSEAKGNLAGLTPIGSHEHLQLRSTELPPKAEVAGALSAWAIEEERPHYEFSLHSLPATLVCTLRFTFLFLFFYFSISFLKIYKRKSTVFNWRQ